jgi:hypothetical protein
MSQEQLMWYGVYLVPLHIQLVKLKMAEVALRGVTIVGQRGVAIHPLYKEIRETMKTLVFVWMKSPFAQPVEPKETETMKRIWDGQPKDYYEAMAEGAGEAEEKPRKRRPI